MRYSYPSDYSAHGNWIGRPSIALGVIERCAHVLRRQSGITYAHLLYIGAGHRRGPWGALAIEINGHTYQLGGGITRFPHVINKDRTLTQSGEILLGTGVVGKVSVDTLEWHWLHDRCDIGCLLDSAAIRQLEQDWRSLVTGKLPIPIFQSWPYTDQYDIPLRSDGMNCTRIQAKMLGPLIGRPELDDDRPLRLFNTLRELEFSHLLSGRPNSSMTPDLDELYARWIHLGERGVLDRLPGLSPEEYRLIVKSKTPLPDTLIDWYSMGF